MAYFPRHSWHDVDDVEAVCREAARRFWNRSCAGMPWQDFEDLVTFLVKAVWRMGERYDPSAGGYDPAKSSFAAIVRIRLPNRCVDWLREHNSRTRWQFSDHTYEQWRPRPVSLDAAAADDRGSLAESVSAVVGDPAADLDSDPFGGLLLDRDRKAAWDSLVVGALARRLLRERSGGARAA